MLTEMADSGIISTLNWNKGKLECDIFSYFTCTA